MIISSGELSRFSQITPNIFTCYQLETEAMQQPVIVEYGALGFNYNSFDIVDSFRLCFKELSMHWVYNSKLCKTCFFKVNVIACVLHNVFLLTIFVSIQKLQSKGMTNRSRGDFCLKKLILGDYIMPVKTYIPLCIDLIYTIALLSL